MTKILLKILIIGLLMLGLNYSGYSNEIFTVKAMKSPINDPSPIILTPEDMPGYIPPGKTTKASSYGDYYNGRLYTDTEDIYLDHDMDLEPNPANPFKFRNKNGCNGIKAFFQEWGQEGWCFGGKEKFWGVGYPIRIWYTFYPDTSSAKYSLDWVLTFGYQQAAVFAMTGGLTETEKSERYYKLKKLKAAGKPTFRMEDEVAPLSDESWKNDSSIYIRKDRLIIHIIAPEGGPSYLAKKILSKIEKSKLY